MQITLTIPDELAIPATRYGLLTEQLLTEFLREKLRCFPSQALSNSVSEEFCCDPYFIPGFHNPETFRKGAINGDIVSPNGDEFEDWEKNQDWWTSK
ncbi:MAG: hypothetical protein LBC74_07580 [Planctomycetaceae bacterium]|jgi:hypothetical protein|nr:hypothetical protein [Planctomycetaceae bacterium]